MMAAWSGIASPMMNSQLTDRRNHRPPARTMAYPAMNETSTAGTTAPTVTMTLLAKYRGKSDWTTSR